MMAAIDLATLAAWESQRCRDQYIRRYIPELILSLRREVSEHPVMRGEVAHIPRRRGAHLGDLGADIYEDADVEIGAADPRGLDDAK